MAKIHRYRPAALPRRSVAGNDVATVTLNDAAADPQAQPGAVLLAGDKGLEQLADLGLGQPQAGNGQPNAQAWPAVWRCPVGVGQRQHIALGHGLDGIDRQVDEHLLQLLPRDTANSPRARITSSGAARSSNRRFKYIRAA